MNKQGWEVKKLGDCFTFIRNGANIKQFTHAKGFPITRIETLSNDKFNRDKLGYADIFDIQKYNKYILESNDILMSHINSTKYLGRAVLYSKNFNETIIHGMNLLCLRACETIINPGYIIHYFRSFDFKDQIAQITKKAVNQASFTVSGLQSFTIPVPPLSIQNQIVKELDTLQAIISKKKAQLVELDSLAQATFYEMFGDPVENEKGWNIKYWKDIFITCTGKLNANAMKDNGQYPFFTCSKQIFYIDVFAFDCEALILAGNNATANYDVKYYNGKFNAYQRTYILNLINKNFSYIYFKFLLESKLDLMQSQSLGINTKYLTMTILNSLNFITPPCSLQNQFAKRIEAIEKQKALINQSISETQLLFDLAMDNYFN